MKNFESPVDESEELKEKLEKWEKIRENVETYRDALGRPLDKNIKEAVAALNAHGVETSQSCEGHSDKGMGAPGVHGGSPGRPEIQFVNEEETYQKVAEEYGIPVEDVKRANNEEAWVRAQSHLGDAGVTSEYKKWLEETKELAESLQKLLDEFYEDREVDSNTKIEIDLNSSWGLTLHNGGEDHVSMHNKLNEAQQREYEKALRAYQEEMEEFAQFLKQKFLGVK